MLTLSNFIW